MSAPVDTSSQPSSARRSRRHHQPAPAVTASTPTSSSAFDASTSSPSSYTPVGSLMADTPSSASSLTQAHRDAHPHEDTEEDDYVAHHVKGKAKAIPTANKPHARSNGEVSGSASSVSEPYRRRTSWLSSSLSKSEHTVVNIGGGPDGVPRLITCVKASQGFDWNPDIFLPSYLTGGMGLGGGMDRDYYESDFMHRNEPVQEVFLTEEEEREMFPS